MGLFKKNRGLSCSLDTGDDSSADIIFNEKVESIKVLGGGMCPSCKKQYEYVLEAVEALGLDVKVEYITDIDTALQYDVMTVPSLVINEKVVSHGKVLNVKTLKQYLNN